MTECAFALAQGARSQRIDREYDITRACQSVWQPAQTLIAVHRRLPVIAMYDH